MHAKIIRCSFVALMAMTGFNFKAVTPTRALEKVDHTSRVLLDTPHAAASKPTIGRHEAIRTYIEFTDGKDRGIYNPETGTGGLPDEAYDATTAMVINWHSLPESNPEHNALLEYRREDPESTVWIKAGGESFPFWYREERVNRVMLKNLTPNSVYAYRVKDGGNVYRFRTMPSDLSDRPIKLVMTGDHQKPAWDARAHDNAKMAALLKPDIFIALGDFVNCQGQITQGNADSWAFYLDCLYNTQHGYFLYEDQINGHTFSNLVIPHVGILGNHDTGKAQHLRGPSCVTTMSPAPGYPQYVAANWMELLFHFPFKSEGFYSEHRPGHPNMSQEDEQPEFGHGGFGALSFSDYLLLIGLDNNCQNWEGEPDRGLRDWEGNLISDRWPWFETLHADIRQDIWLEKLLEPKGRPAASERFQYIIPFWHRGLFGSVRANMSLKNRGIMEYWLPILHRNGVKFFGESHDHLYGRSVPMGIVTEQPPNTYLEKVYYSPRSWKLSPDLPQAYLDKFYAVNCLKDQHTHEIIGWEYKGNYITFQPDGMRAFGYGGWAAGRGRVGDRGAGNAGWWFVDQEKGGLHFTGEESYHLNVIELYPDSLVTTAIHPSQLENIEKGIQPQPIHRITWNNQTRSWSDLDSGNR